MRNMHYLERERERERETQAFSVLRQAPNANYSEEGHSVVPFDFLLLLSRLTFNAQQSALYHWIEFTAVLSASEVPVRHTSAHVCVPTPTLCLLEELGF